MPEDVQVRIADLEARIDKFEKAFNGARGNVSTPQQISKTVVGDTRRITIQALFGKPDPE